MQKIADQQSERYVGRPTRLHTVDPPAYLTSTLTAIVNCHKQSRIEELVPWNYVVAHRLHRDSRQVEVDQGETGTVSVRNSMPPRKSGPPLNLGNV